MDKLDPVLYEGSVKNVRGVKGKAPYVFEFSDRYSVFDWGAMPDEIAGKGAALAQVAWFFFDFLGDAQNWQSWRAPQNFQLSPLLTSLQKEGVRHHAVELRGKNLLAVRPVDILTPPLASNAKDTLIPLEVIFRFGVPAGSSLLSRTHDAAYRRDLGLLEAPEENDTFPLPLIEFSTKLEETDRYLSYAEAQKMSGMTASELKDLTDLARLIALRLKDVFEAKDIALWDGKLEFAFDENRRLMLVDSIGPDELRLIQNGKHLSKEALRRFYRETPWFSATEKAKKEGGKNWQAACIEKPPRLPPALKKEIEDMYESLAARLTQRTVLLLGGGGREHALAWKLSKSRQVGALHVMPGSDGIATVAKTACHKGAADNIHDVLTLAGKIAPDLIVVGPEKPLAAGIVDALEEKGFRVFGPTRAAARLESSKIFAKEFMARHGIPTAPFTVCEHHEDARAKIKPWPIEKDGIVIKADGLAAGKGVVVTHDVAEAEKTIRAFMADPASPIQSPRLLLEEKISGREVSAFALCDGENFVTLGYACDYKRVNDGDQGPNTGGMGGYAPQNWPSPAAKKFVDNNIFKAVLSGMKTEGVPFKGILFAGLMIDGENVRVIEFNTRFGDPETQILMPLIDEDLYDLFSKAARGAIDPATAIKLRPETAVHVVMTSEGYPDPDNKGMRLGEKISLPETLLSNDNHLVFIAGAEKNTGGWVNRGGRVLGVTATGATAAEARDKAYQTIQSIHFNGAHWRKDIAKE